MGRKVREQRQYDLDVECEAEDLSGSASLLEGQPAVDVLQCAVERYGSRLTFATWCRVQPVGTGDSMTSSVTADAATQEDTY